jgi:hypothetical protein
MSASDIASILFQSVAANASVAALLSFFPIGNPQTRNYA